MNNDYYINLFLRSFSQPYYGPVENPPAQPAEGTSKRRSDSISNCNAAAMEILPKEEVPAQAEKKLRLSDEDKKIDLYCYETLENLADGESPDSEKSGKTQSIKVKLLNRFYEKLNDKLFSAEGPAARLMKLRTYFTPIMEEKGQGIDFWRLWLEIPKGTLSERQEELCLNVIIYEAPFDSQFQKCEDKSANCHYIKIVEDDDSYDQALLQIRVDDTAQSGEVIHLQKGKKITGSQVRAIGMRILDFLGLDQVSLVDSATLCAEVPSSNQAKNDDVMLLRRFLPIVSEKGESWYGEVGFIPLKCENMPVTVKGLKKVTQDPDLYFRSVDMVRNMKIAGLFNAVIKQKSPRAEIIKSLYCRYLKQIGEKECFGNETVHDLAKRIYQFSRKLLGTPQEQKQASTDFYEFVRLFLTWEWPKGGQTKSWLEYNQALSNIGMHAIWVKRKAEG